jgi:hypothetical protein
VHFYATPTFAVDSKEKYIVFGAGASSCGKYQTDMMRDPSSDSQYRGWLQGYLSFMNQTTKGLHSIIDDTDFDGAVQWIAKQCREHPTSSYIDAAQDFVIFQLDKLISKNDEQMNKLLKSLEENIR